MTSTIPIDVYATSRELCQNELSSQLRHGTLALVLGAGVSSGMGLPGWRDLVRRCITEAGLSGTIAVDASADTLMKEMGKVEREVGDLEKYKTIVRTCLYETCRDDEALLDQHLLAVIGALTMPSRRGSISEVLTFNFDDVLERYLDLHGFSSQVVIGLPELRSAADVTIFHPHGFLPSPKKSGQASKDLIFSAYSFDKRLGDRLNPWQELLRDFLLRKIAIFVGLSIGGPTLSAVLADVGDSIQKTRGPTGFWLIGPEDPGDTEEHLLERNIVPIRTGKHSDYVEFLLGICQGAM